VVTSVAGAQSRAYSSPFHLKTVFNFKRLCPEPCLLQSLANFCNTS
jgi:hypothetical protein